MSGLLRLHQLSLSGEDESQEADHVREAMNELWEDLSKVEKDRFTGLSKDLYAISDGPAQPFEPISAEQTQAKLGEVIEARERGDWDLALDLLRRWEKHIPPAIVSHQRGEIWQSACEPGVAAVFFSHASHIEPDNEN